MLAAPISIVDCGDADVLQGDRDYSFMCIERAVRRIIKAGTIPMVMGGDHSISIPVGRALSEYGKKICVIQFDAHLDWTSNVGPLVQGNGSPMRRLSEMDHIGQMVQIGLRGMGSGKKRDYDDARAYGSKLISARELHSKGVQYVLDQIPDAEAYYITFDIDGYDMALAPGAASPLPGGITYDESMDMLKAICQTGKVVAMDMVEVAPNYDPTGCTERLAALTMLQVIAHAGKKLHE
jgi:agmatinase